MNQVTESKVQGVQNPVTNTLIQTPVSATSVKPSVLQPMNSVRANSARVNNDNSKMKGNTMPQMDLETPKSKKPLFFILALVVILLGVGSGYGLAIFQNGGLTKTTFGNTEGLQREVASSEITVGTKVGLADPEAFKDSTEGQVEAGGIDGEGSHHLIRPGGESQTVYMTSSVIDMDQFVGRKVKVWGETLASEKAGWFMDVGVLEVLE